MDQATPSDVPSATFGTTFDLVGLALAAGPLLHWIANFSAGTSPQDPVLFAAFERLDRYAITPSAATLHGRVGAALATVTSRDKVLSQYTYHHAISILEKVCTPLLAAMSQELQLTIPYGRPERLQPVHQRADVNPRTPKRREPKPRKNHNHTEPTLL
jgi:hypothetical protein